MSSLFDRWHAALDGLKKLDRFRTLTPPNGHDFTSNDYLGYGNGRVPEGFAPPELPFPELSRSGIASRLLRGHHEVWQAVESELCHWHDAEATLMMTSGYAANEGLLSTVLEPGDWVAYDELSHACIADGLRLARCRRFSFRHNDMAHLEEGLKAEAERQEPTRQRFIVTESLFSMDGDLAPLNAVADLARRYQAHLIVDEAHSTGCYGDTGSGLVDDCGIRDQVLASVHTGGKALAVPGAYVVGSKLLKDYLINKCRHLIFTTALPPECGRWWLEALARVRYDQSGRERLQRNAARLRSALAEVGASLLGTEHVVPVVLGDDGDAVAVASQVRQHGFDVRAIRPPSVPVGSSRVRVSVHADHDEQLLDQLAAAFAEALTAHSQSARLT